MEILKYEGSNFFRQRILLATLSGRSVKITEFEDGISAYEVDLMKLIEKVTSGSQIKIHQSSTALTYRPGVLGGGRIHHDCHPSRGISYYLEILLCLGAFMKIPLHSTLTGVTNHTMDVSVDAIELATFPYLIKFLGTDEGLSLKINKRGVSPEGGGEVVVECPTRQKLRPLLAVEVSKVRKIRGISWAVRVSSSEIKRMTDACKSILNHCTSDVFITSDYRKGPSAGKSPGFGLVLVAERQDGSCITSQALSHPKGSTEGPSLAEDIGREAAFNLMMEIERGGYVDTNNQFLASTLMVLNDRDVSKLIMGPLTLYTIEHLRHLRDFFGVTFKIDTIKDVGRKKRKIDKEEDDDDEEIERKKGKDGEMGRKEAEVGRYVLTCVGVGFKNFSKAVLI